ncbi:Restriction modification system DNA specificity domain-containing protein [Pseudoalteromonas sp. 3J6]|uniref:restriction endonuclease subunit S n=1 Tax=Pseudoalteromonas sp. 3J6 TaxID=649161 RepID=UPI001754BB67|nr:restriction endonuclease subunit S [Pseudoalteromonas sp. 3J6]CAD2224001.1 Restriction modification system DNA specificity domain-containing protein [Pseudoalteromonas sp. 3J6]
MSTLEQTVSKGYKQTELGVIPNDWEVSSLYMLISSTQLGGNYKNLETESNYPLIKMGNLDRGKIKLNKLEYVIGSVSPKDKLKFDDVLFNTRNTLKLVGKVAIWKNELPEAYFNSNIMRLSFKANLVSSNAYMNAAMNTEQFVTNLAGIAIGTTSVAAIYTRDLLQLKIKVPPKKEQTAIANALSDVDALLTELEKLIAKKQAIKTATMQQLLTGKTRLPQFATYTEGAVEGKRKSTKSSELGEIPEDWDVRNLGYLLEENRIPSGLYKDKNLYGTGTAIIKLGDVFKNDSFNPDIVQRVKTTNIENKAYSAKIGDLIIALASVKLEGVGKVMIIKELSEPTVYDHNVALIRFKKNCNSNFMSFLFKSNYIRSLVASRATQVGTTFLKTSTILEFPILLPSPEEQTAIATILSDMDSEIQTLEQCLAKTRQIKQGMMQQLLTGRTRLPFKRLETEQDGGS